MAGEGFYAGALTLPDLIDKIASELLAVAGSNWSDADATWSAGKRALKYQNGSEVFYLALETINTASGEYVYSYSSAYKGKGLRITVAQGWDDIAHAPGGASQK